MEAYTRVKKERNESDIQANEVRITAQNNVRNYITYAMALLEERSHPSVVLKAMGKAINKAVVVAEIIKRRLEGLHQITETSSTNIVDVWEPKEEGLDRIETTRRVSVISITLSREPLDTSNIGYQEPIPADQVRPLDPEELGEGGQRHRRPRGRGRGRGRRGGAAGANGYEDDAADAEAGEGYRGRGRGRGRRGRGRRGGGPAAVDGEVEGGTEGGRRGRRGPPRHRRRGGGHGGDEGADAE